MRSSDLHGSYIRIRSSPVPIRIRAGLRIPPVAIH